MNVRYVETPDGVLLEGGTLIPNEAIRKFTPDAAGSGLVTIQFVGEVWDVDELIEDAEARLLEWMDDDHEDDDSEDQASDGIDLEANAAELAETDDGSNDGDLIADIVAEQALEVSLDAEEADGSHTEEE